MRKITSKKEKITKDNVKYLEKSIFRSKISKENHRLEFSENEIVEREFFFFLKRYRYAITTRKIILKKKLTRNIWKKYIFPSKI